jgi:hypothetical protein
VKQAATLLYLFFLLPASAFAGGPEVVGGPSVGARPPFGIDGQPFTWDPTAMPIHYRVDPGPMAATTTTIVSNAEAVQRVQAMFGVWGSVPTARLSATNDGALLAAGTYAGGDLTTATQFNAIVGSCHSGSQSPIIFDANGALFSSLGLPQEVIAITQICKLDTNNGHILSAMVTMNGRFQDKIDGPLNLEMTAHQFDETLAHEIGHFLGLDHSQINVGLLHGNFPCEVDGLAGLPVMFPAVVCQARIDAGLPALSSDDATWISTLYPGAARANAYGTISGTIFFSDGESQAQGVNVIARQMDDPATPEDESQRFAYSVVSGYRFTANPGQTVTGDNAEGDSSGSRQPSLIGYYEIAVPPGSYTVEVESVEPSFEGSSSVGPLSPPFRIPGAFFDEGEFWNQAETAFDFPLQRDAVTVSPGGAVTDIDIILNNTPPRFDQYEDMGDLMPPYPGKSEREQGRRA